MADETLGTTQVDTAVYQSHPAWMRSQGLDLRHWEAAETTRLNSAHWTYANDDSVNSWLVEHLSTLRQRSIYESRQNGIILGMINTHADDIVGQDGPILQVQSDNTAFNSALEDVWREWFKAPTQRTNVSGAALLKLWIRNLWRCGEFVARLATLPDADGPVAMRLLPTHPRRLTTPATLTGHDSIVMGIEFDRFDRPSRYWIEDQAAMGTSGNSLQCSPYPPDLIIHEFLIDEEDQVRGIPLQATGLSTSADLRDFDDQIQDAARQTADQSAMLYTEHPDAEYWSAPETAEIERRTVRMLPPGWKPYTYQAVQPPVQYPDYRAERQLELGRPVGMPRLLVRLDASKHSWASARLDMTTYRRAIACIQAWLSGSENSVGVLNRLVNEVAREARFSVPDLRNTPDDVAYQWTWPQLDDVEPVKTQQATQIGLVTGAITLIDVLANKKKTLRSHIEEQKRVIEAYDEAGLPRPSWMSGTSQLDEVEVDETDETVSEEDEEETSDAK